MGPGRRVLVHLGKGPASAATRPREQRRLPGLSRGSLGAGQRDEHGCPRLAGAAWVPGRLRTGVFVPAEGPRPTAPAAKPVRGVSPICPPWGCPVLGRSAAGALIEAARGPLSLDMGEREGNASGPPPPLTAPRRAAASPTGRSRGLRRARWLQRSGAWRAGPRSLHVVAQFFPPGSSPGEAFLGNAKCHPRPRSGRVFYPGGPRIGG